MTYTIYTVPVLDDNLIYVISDDDMGQSAIIDMGESQPVLDFLDGKKATDLLLTHHHDDHIAGVGAFRHATQCRVYGNVRDSQRLPALDVHVCAGDSFTILGNLQVEVLCLDGHTIGHVGYYIPYLQAVFVGDAVFTMGCGRAFEVDITIPEQASLYFDSLKRIKALPNDTQIYGGHNYVQSNIAFAKAHMPYLQGDIDFEHYCTDLLAIDGYGMSPTGMFLEQERVYNPFLQAQTVAEFMALRSKKDSF